MQTQHKNPYLLAAICGFCVPFLLPVLMQAWFVMERIFTATIIPTAPKLVIAVQIAWGLVF